MKDWSVKVLVEGAVIIALSTVLGFIKIFTLPWGGGVTLLSMLPIVIFSIKYGIQKGLAVSLVYSFVQLIQGISEGLFGWGLTPAALIGSIFLDYIIAYSVLGLAGMFKSKGFSGWLVGAGAVVFFRFCCHYLSGVVIFKSFGELWQGFSTDNTWLYSLIYNGSYMLPEMIFTLIGAAALLRLPQTKRLITEDKRA